MASSWGASYAGRAWQRQWHLRVNYPQSVWWKCNSKQKKSGLRSTPKDSGRRLDRVKMMRARCSLGPANPLPGRGELTTLALIRGDTGPSNLLSAQFLGTMEFRAHRYTILLTALCLAAWLMRWRLPIGKPNGVKSEVLLLDGRSPHWAGQRLSQKTGSEKPLRGGGFSRLFFRRFERVKDRWCFLQKCNANPLRR